MSLARAAWSATLTNHTRGWSYTTYAGQPADENAAVRLLGDWTVDWSHRNGEQWEPLDPCITQVRLATDSVDDLPVVDFDDEMSLHVVRPVAAGDPIVWFHSFGGVSDLDAAPNWKTGTTVAITFVDPRAALAGRTHVATDQPFAFNVGMTQISGASGAPATLWGSFVDPKWVEGASFADVIDLYANLYAGAGWFTWRLAHRYTAPPPAVMDGPSGPYSFYYENWPTPALTAGSAMPSLFTLAVQGGILTAGTFKPQLTPAAMTVIPASAVLSPVPWKKDANNGEVAIDVTGLTFDGENTESLSVVVGPTTSSKKTTRVTLPTILNTLDGMSAAGAHRRELRQETTDWRTPALTIDTTLLTDAQVDYLAAGRLFPRQRPYDSSRGISPVVVVGAHPESNLSGALITGLPVGAKFRITGGKLLIDLNISAWSLRTDGSAASIPGPTYAQLNTAFPTLDYDHVDPSLTYDDLALAGL